MATADAAARAGEPYSAAPWPTGFSPLDRELAGGLRAGELIVVGGAPGLGKTTFALQIARNIVSAGGRAAYVCYEHEERVLLQKLVAMEAGLADPVDGATLAQLATSLRAPGATDQGLLGRIGRLPGAAAALVHIASYADRMQLVSASGRSTGPEEIRAIAAGLDGGGVVLVDYLQKVAVGNSAGTEDDRVSVVVESLKDCAMEFGVPVIAICAADHHGLAAGRTTLAHMRGSTAIAYEADIALMLNDKWHAVARHHLMYSTVNAEQFREWVICSIEKNRTGRADIDIEFQKQFSHSRFDPCGRLVREELIDRIFRE
ncbi:MAG: DnaB-like helicase C-terminal domain-containing protein [Actinomycetota bacterium]